MEFGERKRRRKSQSYKLVKDQEFDPMYFDSSVNRDVNGESKDAAVPEVWLEDEGMEIKKQITGMMRLLSDKAGRIYQRVGSEGDSLKQEPQEMHQSWAQPVTFPLVSEDHQLCVWSSTGEPVSALSSNTTSVPNGQGYNQYSTRSKTLRMLNNAKGAVKTNDVPPVDVEAPCCMCNCKSTLEAILQELRGMRRLMQVQRGSQDQQQSISPCPPCPVPSQRRRPRKRRPVHKVAPLSTPSKRIVAPLRPPYSTVTLPPEPGGTRVIKRERISSPASPVPPDVTTVQAQNKPSAVIGPHSPHYGQPRAQQSSESDVLLAEEYDVVIPKTQLDSILVNYTRSGSLLFRKLVCAFFDDATLANSLPNGKRKRGLNDHRKGLDQNIVGAIKVFTEKYCTANRIEKLPGPRDWVQILQDQIKLARRRLKRGCNSGNSASLIEARKNVTD
ncbi:BEN domain-containing protein 7 [Hypomesus transpacificus]|uniref:BEN domain-containing protein 7 n=1 Tax=Hypomesus transpacificus TaxID=137520 RepID=UPI001F08118C|nr:BEN domain-containing protein 7 [Hypomesus transpacificus]